VKNREFIALLGGAASSADLLLAASPPVSAML
jgi:hypothetical protein